MSTNDYLELPWQGDPAEIVAAFHDSEGGAAERLAAVLDRVELRADRATGGAA